MDNITLEDILDDTNALIEKLEVKESSIGLFTLMPANQWIEQAKNRPIPLMLFGELWHESEICILFADTNLGKSILAVQIGDSISKGKQIKGFKLTAEQQPVLYFDFELSDKQFENRYSINYQEHYKFDANLKRIEINPDAEIPTTEGFETALYNSIEQSIISTSAKVLIIDNLTYLKSATETSRDALPLMKDLKRLKSKYKLSILCLAHTPKRNLTLPITRNDLQGSKMLINFCDSAFAIGESYNDKNLRYIKQIKQRNTEQIYDAENVITCQICKPSNFLHFEFLGFGTEKEHLKELSENDKNNKIEKVKQLSAEGKSQRQISLEIGLSLGAVNKYLKM